MTREALERLIDRPLPPEVWVRTLDNGNTAVSYVSMSGMRRCGAILPPDASEATAHSCLRRMFQVIGDWA